jgi:hypothetical protein
MAQRYTGRQRAYKTLAADIEDFVAVSDKRMTALMRQSISDVIDNAQQAKAKGGRMRVDTGFLRASGQVSLNAMPSGPSRPSQNFDDEGNTIKDTFTYNDKNVTVTLGKAKLGAIIFFGWTANYAKYRELYDGFLEGALQHWSRIVAFNTDTIRQRIKK